MRGLEAAADGNCRTCRRCANSLHKSLKARTSGRHQQSSNLSQMSKFQSRTWFSYHLPWKASVDCTVGVRAVFGWFFFYHYSDTTSVQNNNETISARKSGKTNCGDVNGFDHLRGQTSISSVFPLTQHVRTSGMCFLLTPDEKYVRLFRKPIEKQLMASWNKSFHNVRF